MNDFFGSIFYFFQLLNNIKTFVLSLILSRLYIAVGKKKEDVDLLFLLFFRQPPPSKVFYQ